jgi:hypothetical protein
VDPKALTPSTFQEPLSPIDISANRDSTTSFMKLANKVEMYLAANAAETASNDFYTYETVTANFVSGKVKSASMFGIIAMNSSGPLFCESNNDYYFYLKPQTHFQSWLLRHEKITVSNRDATFVIDNPKDNFADGWDIVLEYQRQQEDGGDFVPLVIQPELDLSEHRSKLTLRYKASAKLRDVVIRLEMGTIIENLGFGVEKINDQRQSTLIWYVGNMKPDVEDAVSAKFDTPRTPLDMKLNVTFSLRGYTTIHSMAGEPVSIHQETEK